MTQPDKAPTCHGRAMWPVISRKTDTHALDRTKDTPVWFCPDCQRKVVRVVEPAPEGGR